MIFLIIYLISAGCLFYISLADEEMQTPQYKWFQIFFVVPVVNTAIMLIIIFLDSIPKEENDEQ